MQMLRGDAAGRCEGAAQARREGRRGSSGRSPRGGAPRGGAPGGPATCRARARGGRRRRGSRSGRSRLVPRGWFRSMASGTYIESCQYRKWSISCRHGQVRRPRRPPPRGARRPGPPGDRAPARLRRDRLRLRLQRLQRPLAADRVAPPPRAPRGRRSSTGSGGGPGSGTASTRRWPSDSPRSPASSLPGAPRPATALGGPAEVTRRRLPVVEIGMPKAGGAGPVTRLRVATLNLRNLADRWEERLPLLLADTAALRPDLLGLQEVVYPMQQDRLLAAATPDEHAIHRGWAGRPEYGNSLLVRAPLAAIGAGRASRPGPRAVGSPRRRRPARRGHASSSP